MTVNEIRHLYVTSGGARLAAARLGSDPRIVLLHAGVADRRSWFGVMGALGSDAPSLAYDRRGYGSTGPATEPHSHVDDLGVVLDRCVSGAVTLVGNSQGGRVAIDFALAQPWRVERLVLIAPAVSGAPPLDLDPDLGRLAAEIEEAEEAGDLRTVNRLEALLWLDGPAGPEGRIGGAARDLFLDMNGVALASKGGPVEREPPPAWERLDTLSHPTLVVVGNLDLPSVVERCRSICERLPRSCLAELPHRAHLPQLEDPVQVASLIRDWQGEPQDWQTGHQ